MHFDVNKIPPFTTKTKQVSANPNPSYVYLNKRHRRGYHFVEILIRMNYCWFGLPRKYFPKLEKDLKRLIKENEKIYLAIYDKDAKDVQIFFNNFEQNLNIENNIPDFINCLQGISQISIIQNLIAKNTLSMR